MIPWYNRSPWNLVVGLCLIVGIFVALASVTSPWLLVLPPAYIAFIYLRTWGRRTISLRTKGYFSGRRVLDKWIYEERVGNSVNSLTLDVANTEPGHWEMFFPTDSEWRGSVPSWARERRTEIARRIAEGWKHKDFHLPQDFDDA